MSDDQRDQIEAYAAIAKAVVDRLLSITSETEPDEWRSRYLVIQDALSDGRFRDAIRENSRLGLESVEPNWVASRELTRFLTKALGNLASELRLPNPGKTKIDLAQLPNDVICLGTIADEKERLLQESHGWFKRDPIEEDPEYAVLLRQVDEMVDKNLECHPMRGGIGFCHVIWDTKKQVLKNEYKIDWRTPSEMNPDIFFD